MTIRPLRRAVALRARVDALSAPGRRGPVRLAVVGAGAGGVEVALALHRRIRDAGPRPEVTLIETAPDVLPDYEATARRRAVDILARRGIAIALGSAVHRVEDGAGRSRAARASRRISSSGLSAPPVRGCWRAPGSRSTTAAFFSSTQRSGPSAAPPSGAPGTA